MLVSFMDRGVIVIVYLLHYLPTKLIRFYSSKTIYLRVNICSVYTDVQESGMSCPVSFNTLSRRIIEAVQRGILFKEMLSVTVI